jgi:hypothetical protein
MIKVAHLIFVFLLFAGVCFAQNLTTGLGSYTFSQYRPLSNRPIKVYYYLPSGSTVNMPIVFVLHGEDRIAQDYRQDWIAAANQHKFIVVAPEFSDQYYPGGDVYNLCNIFTNGDSPTPTTLRPDSLWTFSVFDPLFRDIQNRTGSQVTQYFAFGHSAGSQVLHRFTLYKPDNLMKLAICANAGWYTVPSTTVVFPYGLAASPYSAQQLQKSFGKKLLVLLGGADINPNSPNLRHNAQADAQGLYRLARGRYFFSAAKNQALQLNTPFNWTTAEVAGVGHDHTLMANAAVPYIIQAFDSVTKKAAESRLTVRYEDQSFKIEGLNENETYNVKVYSISGQEYSNLSGIGSGSITINTPSLLPGIYLMIINTSQHGFVKRKIFIY